MSKPHQSRSRYRMEMILVLGDSKRTLKENSLVRTFRIGCLNDVIKKDNNSCKAYYENKVFSFAVETSQFIRRK